MSNLQLIKFCNAMIGYPTCLSTYLFAYLRAANRERFGRGYCSRLSQMVFNLLGKRNSDSITELQAKFEGLPIYTQTDNTVKQVAVLAVFLQDGRIWWNVWVSI